MTARIALFLMVLVFSASAGVSHNPGAPTKRDTVFSPPPPYPYEARANGLEGSGVFIMHIDRKTGAVTSVTIEKSTGVPILDQAAVKGLGRWKFKVPMDFKGTKVRCPIAYWLPDSTKAHLKRKHKADSQEPSQLSTLS